MTNDNLRGMSIIQLLWEAESALSIALEKEQNNPKRKPSDGYRVSRLDMITNAYGYAHGAAQWDYSDDPLPDTGADQVR